MDDFPDLDKVVEFLICCSQLRSASSLSPAVRPRAILAFGAANGRQERVASDMQLLFQKLKEFRCIDLSELFSDIRSIHLADSHLSVAARYERMETMIGGQLSVMHANRQEHLQQLAEYSPSISSILFPEMFR